MATATSMGYCMKCKVQRDMKDPEHITMKNGRTRHSRHLSDVRHEDLQDRCCQIGLGKPTARLRVQRNEHSRSRPAGVRLPAMPVELLIGVLLAGGGWRAGRLLHQCLLGQVLDSIQGAAGAALFLEESALTGPLHRP